MAHIRSDSLCLRRENPGSILDLFFRRVHRGNPRSDGVPSIPLESDPDRSPGIECAILALNRGRCPSPIYLLSGSLATTKSSSGPSSSSADATSPSPGRLSYLKSKGCDKWVCERIFAPQIQQVCFCVFGIQAMKRPNPDFEYRNGSQYHGPVDPEAIVPAGRGRLNGCRPTSRTRAGCAPFAASHERLGSGGLFARGAGRTSQYT